MNSINYMTSKAAGKRSGPGKTRANQCPFCNKKDVFVWKEEHPHIYKCNACQEKGNVYTLGFTDGNIKKLDDTEYLVSNYRKETGKNHRLSTRIIDHFKIKPIEFTSKKGTPYKCLCITNADKRATKRLIGKQWIAFDKQYQPDDFWHNLQNISIYTIDTIYVLAGEWDLFAFWEHTGIDGISPIFGEGPRKFDVKHLEIFANKNVIILYDNDTTGRAGAQSLSTAILRQVKTKSVKSIDLSEIGVLAGQDIDVFFNQNGTTERLFNHINETQNVNVQIVKAATMQVNNVPIRALEFTIEHSIYTKDIQQAVWNVGRMPENKRLAVFSQLATEHFEADKKSEIMMHVNNFRRELNSLNFIAIEKMVLNFIIKKSIIRKKSESQMFGEKNLYYYYDNGKYSLLTESIINQQADLIAREILPIDLRLNLSKYRKQILEDIGHALNNVKEIPIDLDSDIINFKNGLYSLSTQKLYKHSKFYFSSHQLSFDYTESNNCPNFKKALSQWLDKDDQKEMIKAMYYALSDHTRSKHLALFFHGGGGDGKGECSEIFRHLLGLEKTSGIRLDDIKTSPHIVAELYGKKLNISDETDRKGRFPDGLFKTLTGGGIIEANPKYEKMFTFRSQALWLILSNTLPVSSDNSRGFSRRLKFFQFNKLNKKNLVYNFFDTKLKIEMPEIASYVLKEGHELWIKENGFLATTTDETTINETLRQNPGNQYWIDICTEYFNYLEKMEENKKNDYNIEIPSEYRIVKNDKTDKSGQTIHYIDIDIHYKDYKELCTEGSYNPMNMENFRQSSRNILERLFDNSILTKYYELSYQSRALRLESLANPDKKKPRRVLQIVRKRLEKSVHPIEKKQEIKINNEKNLDF